MFRLAHFVDSVNPMAGRLTGSLLTLRSFRLSCLIAALLLPAFGWLYHTSGSAVVDPWAFRWAGTVLAVVAFAATYASEWVRRHTCPLHQGGIYGMTAYFSWLTWANGLSADYAVGYLLVFVVLALSHSLAYTERRPFVRYLVVSTAAALAVVAASPEAGVPRPLFAASVGALASLLYIAVVARMATYRALEVSQAQHTAAEALAGAGSWEVRLTDSHRTWSEGTYRLFGLPLGSGPPSMLDLIHPDDRAAVQAVRGELIASGGTAEHTFRTVAADGTTRTLRSISRAEAARDGTVKRIYGALLDVSEQAAREEALRDARDRAEEGARAKSAFLANMSHEIRTPLTAIIGFAQLLGEETGPEHRDLVRPIEAGGLRLLDTLNSVLDLARMDAGHIDLTAGPVDTGAEVRSVVELLGRHAARKGVALVAEVAPGTPAAWADRPAVARVLANLVSNAVKFTDAGHVTVAARPAAGLAGTGVELCVTDTGCGMSPTFLEAIYQPFQQASTGWGRTHEGTGLGLTIVHRLVGGMGGEVAVESAVGRGTRFTVRLPAAPADVLADVPTVSARARAAV